MAQHKGQARHTCEVCQKPSKTFCEYWEHLCSRHPEVAKAKNQAKEECEKALLKAEDSETKAKILLEAA